MAKIYGFFNAVDPNRDSVAVAINEFGVCLAQHWCSNESWAVHDLGMDGECDWKHDSYNEAHPDGWETEFVFHDQVDGHEGLQSALKLNELMPEDD